MGGGSGEVRMMVSAACRQRIARFSAPLVTPRPNSRRQFADPHRSAYQSRLRVSTPLSTPTSFLSSSKSAFFPSPLR